MSGVQTTDLQQQLAAVNKAIADLQSNLAVSEADFERSSLLAGAGEVGALLGMMRASADAIEVVGATAVPEIGLPYQVIREVIDGLQDNSVLGQVGTGAGAVSDTAEGMKDILGTKGAVGFLAEHGVSEAGIVSLAGDPGAFLKR